MVDKVLLHERCLALQLVREAPSFVRTRSQHAPSGLPPLPQAVPRQSNGWKHGQPQYASLRRPKSQDTSAIYNVPVPVYHSVPNSPVKANESPQDRRSSSDSGTPTPTNPVSPEFYPRSPQRPGVGGYNDGLLLFQAWVSVNAANVWNEELVRAVNGVHFLGILTGGYLLVGGSPRILAAICHAHSRALLSPPPGWIIVLLGELRECEATVVAKGQFTPLADALCWVINRLSSFGQEADQVTVRNALLVHFPSMSPPEPSLIHAALTDLIRQRKVFHSVKGYGIVRNATYAASPVRKLPPGQPPLKLLTTSEALTKAHGDTVLERVGNATHAAVQTDLVDLLKSSWPASSSIVLNEQPRSSTANFHRTQSLKHSLPLTANQSIFVGRHINRLLQYKDSDLSDITVKAGAEKSSMLSKLLRVSQPRSRLATFSGQFPPPQWTKTENHEKHFHSISTQTQLEPTSGPETCWLGNSFWVSRSSTLPRRPSRTIENEAETTVRPHSASPSHRKISKTKKSSISKQSDSSSFASPLDTSRSSRNGSPSINSTGDRNEIIIEKNDASNRNSALTVRTGSSNLLRETKMFQESSRKVVPLTVKPLPTKQTIGGCNSLPPVCKQSEHNVNGPLRVLSHHSLPRRVPMQKSNEKSTSVIGSLNEVDAMARKHNLFNSQHTISGTDRTKLELTLRENYMNNSKNLISSPQKPEGLQKNVLHETPITKESTSDITSKNLGYIEIDKSKKKMYQSSENGDTGDCSSSDSIMKEKLTAAEILMSGTDENSVKNFPSLSNLNFSSLAAQKIIQGVSMNSIDTIVEVNMVAEKLRSPLDEPVTNTEFGFV